MKKIYILMLVLLGTAGFAQNSPIFGGGIGDGFSYGYHMQWTNDIYVGGNGDGWSSGASSLTTLAVQEQDFSAGLKVFPNPTAGQLEIRLGQPATLINVEVSDLNGRIVMKKETSNSETVQILITGSAGVYIVKIIADGRTASYKIVKN